MGLRVIRDKIDTDLCLEGVRDNTHAADIALGSIRLKDIVLMPRVPTEAQWASVAKATDMTYSQVLNMYDSLLDLSPYAEDDR